MAKYLDNDGLLYLWQKIKNVFVTKDALNDKVDKVTGKGLSTNDYTTDEKNKLNGIQAGAKSVSYTGSSAAAQTSTLVAVTVGEETVMLHAENEEYIAVPTGEAAMAALNAKVDKQDGKGLSTNDYTTTEKNKLNGIEAGAQVNPQVVVDGHGRKISVYMLNNDKGVLVMGYNDPSPDGGTIAVPLASTAQEAIESLSNALAGKVDAEDGKGLSTNDYTTAEKNKLAAFGAASTYALKTDITNMYKYKGSVATVSALPSSDNTTGDVYNVEATGMNYAWNGTAWDALGEIFTITSISNGDIDTIVAS